MKHGNNGTQTVTIPKPTNSSPESAPSSTAPPQKSEPVGWWSARSRNYSWQSPKERWFDFPLKRKAEVEKFKTAHETIETPKRLAEAEAESHYRTPETTGRHCGKAQGQFLRSEDNGRL